MERRKQKKHLITIIMMFLAISAMNFALPQRADAAEPTVKIGGVDISSYNDNVWHAYNSNKPAITGWSAGEYKLSKDKRTLFIKDVKYSGSKCGISSTEDITIVTSGTNTFTCNGARGIFIGTSETDRKMLTIGSASTGILNLKCNNDYYDAVAVGNYSMSAGTVKATGDLLCDGSFTVSGGNLDVTGGVNTGDEATISGGKVYISELLDVFGWDEVEEAYCAADLKVTGGTLTVGEYLYVKELTISGADVSVPTGRVLCNDLSVSNGTLKVTNPTDNGQLIMVSNNATISGTGKVEASANNEPAFHANTLTVNGGTFEATNTAVPNSNNGACSCVQVGTLSVTGGTVRATANGSGGRAINVNNGLTISGGSVTGISTDPGNYWETIYAGNLIKATGGVLSGTNSSTGGGLCADKMYISAAADVSGTSKGGTGVAVAQTIMVSGGKLTGRSNGNIGITSTDIDMTAGTIDGAGEGWTGIIVYETLTVSGGKLTGRSNGNIGITSTDIDMTAGTIDGAGVGGGVSSENITITGGAMRGERTSPDRRGDGVNAWRSFRMTGGKVTGKGDAGRAICAPLDGTELDPDIWLSYPAGGVTSYHKYMGSSQTRFLEEYDVNGDKSETATLQKVTSISVSTPPTTTYYRGDYFKPDGLGLGLTFEDGSKSTLEYNGPNTYREGVISFDCADQSLDQPLEPGKHVVKVTCLNCTDTFTINVKDIGSTTLSGTASSDSQTLKWDPVDGVQGYQVFGRKADNNDYELMRTSRACTTDITGMQPGETWEYYVVPVRISNTGGEVCGGNSNVVRLTTDISAPEITLSGSNYDSASLTWGEVTGAKGYEVYRSDDDGPYNKIKDVKGTAYTDTGLVTGRKYAYYVKSAIPEENVSSPESNTVEVTPGFAGETTLEVKSAGKYELSWTETDGATSYEIRRGSGPDGERELLTVTEGAVTSFRDESADIYSVYNYTVVPLRSTEAGDFRGTESNTAVTVATPKPEIKPPQKEEPDGTTFGLLQARAGKATKKSVQIKWKQVPGAKSYVIYGNKCGKKNKYVRITTTTGSALTFKSVAGKKVRKGTYYKFLVYALDGSGNMITASKTIHVATKGGKVGNDKSVKTAAKKNNVTLGKGKTFRLKAKAIPASKRLKVRRHRKIAYESSNNSVASVTPNGIIKANGSGTCYVYAYAQNGVFKMIRVTVTE